MGQAVRAFVARTTAAGTQGQVEDVAPETLPAGEVTIAVEYSSLNFKDALAAGRVVDTLLFGVTPFDAVSYAAATAALALAVLVAAWWPARRAARVSPLIALSGRT